MDSRLGLDKEFTQETVMELHRFAQRTVNRIMEKIARLNIKDTGALMNSIKATVHTNAGGNQALVQFFYLYYGDCVEQAVGKYRGIDNDLGDRQGVKSLNIQAPEITGAGYGPLTPSFSGIPESIQTKGKHEGEFRGKYHRPRPFLRSTIQRSVDYVGWRLANVGAQLIDMHMVHDIDGFLTEGVKSMIMTPFDKGGTTATIHTQTGPNGNWRALSTFSS